MRVIAGVLLAVGLLAQVATKVRSTLISGQFGPGDTVNADLGVLIAGANPKRIGVDPATVPTFLTGTASLQFASFGPGCIDGQIPLQGASTADAVAPGWPSSIEAGVHGMMFVRSPGHSITVRLCRTAAGPVANQTFRATIVRPF
jgi:hypothetical protein